MAMRKQTPYVLSMSPQAPNPESASPNIRYLGIDLGGTSVKFGRVTETGVIEYQSQSPTASAEGRDALLSQLGDIGGALVKEAHQHGLVAPYLGIVAPGTVDAQGGRIIAGSPNIPNWVGAEISRTLEPRLGIPVLVENDARGMALAEFRLGAGRNVSSTLSLTIGTGIGGAIIINNQLWRGHGQSAGEIGHTLIDVDDSLMDANDQDSTSAIPPAGTLENLTSARAIERRIKRKISEHGISEAFGKLLNGAKPGTLVARQVFKAYHLGDKLAVECLKETGDILGCALAGFVNLLNPEMVIIGGGVTDAIPEIVDWVAEKIKATALSSATADLSVRRAELGNSAGLLGAALLGREPFWQEILRHKQK
jgi:glucokinase